MKSPSTFGLEPTGSELAFSPGDAIMSAAVLCFQFVSLRIVSTFLFLRVVRRMKRAAIGERESLQIIGLTGLPSHQNNLGSRCSIYPLFFIQHVLIAGSLA